MNLPPEVEGCLSVARNHTLTANYFYGPCPRHWGRVRKDKHLQKAQRLINKAIALLKKRGGA